MDTVYSVNGVPIRLTEERWEHIVNNNPYMEAYYEKVLDAIEQPTWVLRGYVGTLVAILTLGRQQCLYVVYREVSRKVWIHCHCVYRAESKSGANSMAKEAIAEKSLGHLLKAVAHLVQLPKHRMWLDYDEEVDVLYVHFVDKPNSTHSELREDGVIFDYRGKELVGVTVMEASHR